MQSSKSNTSRLRQYKRAQGREISGKKWFAFSKLDKQSVDNILKSIKDE